MARNCWPAHGRTRTGADAAGGPGGGGGGQAHARAGGVGRVVDGVAQSAGMFVGAAPHRERHPIRSRGRPDREGGRTFRSRRRSRRAFPPPPSRRRAGPPRRLRATVRNRAAPPGNGFGAGGKNRTCDLCRIVAALYRLSYTRNPSLRLSGYTLRPSMSTAPGATGFRLPPRAGSKMRRPAPSRRRDGAANGSGGDAAGVSLRRPSLATAPFALAAAAWKRPERTVPRMFGRAGLYGETGRATRKPVELSRIPERILWRLADRKRRERSRQEPPRTTRREQSPPPSRSHALSSEGACA